MKKVLFCVDPYKIVVNLQGKRAPISKRLTTMYKAIGEKVGQAISILCIVAMASGLQRQA